MSEYLIKKALLEWLNHEIKDDNWAQFSAERALMDVRNFVESGMFDADESEGTWKATAEVLGRENAQMNTEIQRLRAALASLPDKIMDMKWTDTEELTFPLDNPTAEEQNEWLNEFIDRLDMHVRNTIENELEALSTTSEPTGAERVREPVAWFAQQMEAKLRENDGQLQEQLQSAQQEIEHLKSELEAWHNSNHASSVIQRLNKERDKLIEGLHNYMKELDRRYQKAYRNYDIDCDHHQLGMAEAYEVAERRLRDILKEIGVTVE